MDWTDRMAALLAGHHSITGDPLDAGARLVVTEHGTEVFRAALARHHRIEDDVIWIRPIVAGAPDPDTGLPVYNLSLCRRRALQWIHARENAAGGLEIALTSGQHARIEPADGPDLDELAAWDTFTLLELTVEEQAQLEALDSDGWIGRYS